MDPTSRASALVAIASVLVLLAVTLITAGAPLYTDDLWWHLTAGEMYLYEGPWPAADATLHTALDSGPVQHEWLFGILVHLVDLGAGLFGLRALHAAAVALGLWLVWSIARRAAGAVEPAALVLCAFVVLAAPRLGQLRPDLVSICAALLAYRLLVERGCAPGAARIAAFAALIALWANMHSLFLVGVNLIVAALLGVVLERVLARALLAEPWAGWDARRRLGALGIAIGCALLAAALNPRGFGQHLTFFSSSHGAAIWFITDEWSRFDPFSPGANHSVVSLAAWLSADAVILGFVLTAAGRARALLGSRDAASLARLDAVHLGLGLAGIVAALVSIRFLWMLVFPALYLARAWPSPPERARRAAVAAALAALALAVSIPLGAVFAGFTVRFAGAPLDYVRLPYRSHKYHAEGVHFLQASGVRGNLYNPYWMGGFLGYWLRPHLRTFVDGRTEHYEPAVYDDYSAVLQMQGAREGEFFPDVLDRRAVDLHFGVGFPSWWVGVYTTTQFEGMPGWILVSRSYRHAIHLRDVPRNADTLERVAAWYRAEGVPFDPTTGLDPGRVIRERPDWAVAHAMLPPHYETLVAARSAADPATRAAALEQLGVLYLLNGAYAEQVEVETERLALEPGAHEARLRLAFGLLALGRLEAGRAEAARALAEAPGNARAQRLVRVAGQIEQLRSSLVESQRGVPERTFINRALKRAIPLGADQTWPVEHVIETERFDLVRPPRGP